jgi:hypothetical protein
MTERQRRDELTRKHKIGGPKNTTMKIADQAAATKRKVSGQQTGQFPLNTIQQDKDLGGYAD